MVVFWERHAEQQCQHFTTSMFHLVNQSPEKYTKVQNQISCLIRRHLNHHMTQRLLTILKRQRQMMPFRATLNYNCNHNYTDIIGIIFKGIFFSHRTIKHRQAIKIHQLLAHKNKKPEM